MLRKLKWQIPGEPLADRYNWCQGPVPGRGPAVEKHWSKMTIATHVQQMLCVLVSSKKVIACLFLFLETTKLIFTPPPTLSSPLDYPWRTLASFRTNFQASPSQAIFLQPLKPICFRLFSTSSNHIFLSFTMQLSPSGIFLKHFLHSFSCGTLSNCSNRRNIPFSNFWDNIGFIIQTHQFLTGDDQQTWYTYGYSRNTGNQNTHKSLQYCSMFFN